MPRAIKIFTQLVHALCALFVRQTNQQSLQFQFKEHGEKKEKRLADWLNLVMYQILELH